MSYMFGIEHKKTHWDTFLEDLTAQFPDSPTPTTFIQGWEWLEFQTSLGKKTYAVFARDMHRKIVGIAACVVVRAKRGSYLYIRNGPVLDWSDTELVDGMIEYLKKIAKKEKLWAVRMSPMVQEGSVGDRVIARYKFPKFPMNDVEALDTWLMDISGTEDEIMQRIDKKTRYEIRKAKKKGVEVEVSMNPDDIDHYYEILKDTVERQDWVINSKEYIRGEFAAFAKNNNASLVLMKYEGTYIAAGVFIHYLDRTFYHYGASLTEFQKIPASYLMIWEAIRVAKEKKHAYFDFFGIAPENKPNHPWAGLTRFKKKFPGFEQRWRHAVDIPISRKYFLTNIYERIDKWRKGY